MCGKWEVGNQYTRRSHLGYQPAGTNQLAPTTNTEYLYGYQTLVVIFLIIVIERSYNRLRVQKKKFEFGEMKIEIESEIEIEIVDSFRQDCRTCQYYFF